MNNLKLVHQACKNLKKISSQPFMESQWILSFVLKKPLSEIYQKPLSKNQKKLFFKTVQKREQGWPLPYLLKEVYFFNDSFYIEPGVFIPRPESERIVQEVFNLNLPFIRAVDLGSGSGVLSLTLLNQIPESEFVALEISSPSLRSLKINREKFKLEGRLHILNQDVFHVTKKDLAKVWKQKPNLVLANPPYICPQDRKLQKGVRDFEPPLALFSCEGGLSHIYSWFHKARELLEGEGFYLFEFGYDQANKVCQFLDQESCRYRIIKDEQNINRIALCWEV